jgi:arylesterase/paraoxonase
VRVRHFRLSAHSITYINVFLEIVLHQPTGVLFLACSTPSSRTHWVPSANKLNATGASFSDYVATYDPKTKRTTRLEVVNYKSNRGLSLHGMDVVPSSTNSKDLFVYLINHRAPLGGKEASKVGADTSIEIFKIPSGGQKLVHQMTVENSLLISPNDVIGSPDGKSFHFTNDIGKKASAVCSRLFT